jgi:uncharacterized BrkB/YihY/UPF0761 family membrane protein
MTGVPLPAFGWGPIAVAGLILIVGFVGIQGYRAWRADERFHIETRDFIAFLIVIAFIGTVIYSFVNGATQQLDILMGALIAAVGAIVAFYFNMPPPP